MITVDFNCLEIEPGSRILDIGCGSGRHVAAAYAIDRTVVVGADANTEDLQKARSRLKFHDLVGEHGNGRWCLNAADITRLPYADACFDLVICSEVLEHIPDHQRAIDEIVRVLKPGRPLVVSVPRSWPETICWALSSGYRHDPGGHVRIYHGKALVRKIAVRGLKHWRTHYAHGLHSPYWWLKCLLGLKRDSLWPVVLYHRFLTWDLMKKPKLTRTIERMIDPVMGKSVVFYFQKAAT